jgi:integrase
MQGLYKRGEVWWIDMVFRDRRVRKSLNTRNKKLAERIYHKIKNGALESQWFEVTTKSKKTFEDLMKHYLKEQSPRKSKLSQIRDRSASKHLLDFFGDMTLTNLSKRHVGEYKAKRRLDEAAPATINKELGLLKHAFNLAVKEWEWLNTNAISSVSLEPVNNARDRWLTWEEERALLEVCPGWLKEIVVFALNTGMRLGEIVNLKWKNVDLSRGVMTLVRSKNHLRASIPLNSAVYELLMMKPRLPRCEHIFCSKADTRLNERNLKRAFMIAREKADLQDMRFHDLRHTFATRLVQNGVDLYRVQRLLGHKSHVMTQRYAHHCPESLRSAVKVLEKAGHVTITSQSVVD